MSEDGMKDLTEAQRRAVLHENGPMLVLAGPGSGKTRVITRRIAHLISLGHPPRRILALTFTNKAAEEMRNRLRTMDVPDGALLCTFHALCLRLLREFAGRAGLPPSFSIWDQADQRNTVKALCGEFGLDPRRVYPGAVARWISAVKNAGVSPSEIASPFDREAKVDTAELFFAAYQKRLAASAALDFDDLLVRTARLLSDDAELRGRLNRRWSHVLVDEYQDTNNSQYRIARELVRDHGNLFVTGDPDQSIYAWRGADIRNILAFEHDFPDAIVVRLEENFRSSPQVLELADAVIKENVRRKEKRLIARKPAGPPPELARYADEHDEARGTAEWLRARREEDGIDYGRMAVFYRTNAMSRVLEEALVRAGLPYRIVKGLEFFDRKEVKDVLVYLRLTVNPADEPSLVRIINRPARGIGNATVERLIRRARKSDRTVWDIVREAGLVPDLSAGVVARLKRFVEMIDGFRPLLDRPVGELVRAVYDRSGLKAAHEAEKDTEAVENVEELIHSAVDFDAERTEPGGLDEYLQKIALVSDADAYDAESGAVSLMTLHSAKGLEFPAVAIVGVEDGIIPHALSLADGRDAEEERRLLFVGITRAERRLILSRAMVRTVFGTARPTRLSPFLRNIAGLETVSNLPEEGFFEQRLYARTRDSSPDRNSWEFPRKSKTPPEPPPWAQSGQSPADAGTTAAYSADLPFSRNQRVRHPALGPGKIVDFSGEGEQLRVIFQSDNGPRVALGRKAALLLEPLV
jgi:DNA helicase-2/ATP-dependent DNA helicase PcrA